MFLRKKFDDKRPIFMGVAIATLLAGAALIALGLVELGFNVWGNTTFNVPTYKVIGGLIVLSLGYIHMELELMRVKK